MAPDTIKIEVSKNIVKELYDFAGLEVPKEIKDEEFLRLIKTLKNTFSLNEAEKQDKSDSQTKSILVVDDLGLIVYQLSLLLTKNGYNVMLARSSPEAFTIFEERGPFDFVLTDLFMPNKEDGIELLSNIRNQTKEKNLTTKIIVMSATKDLDAIDEVLKLGADSFLEKGHHWKTDLLKSLKDL